MKIKLISMILVFAFTLSSLGYGPISVWAQEYSNYPTPGIQNTNPNPNVMNPCFRPHGNFIGMHHFGQGNFTGMHHFGQGNYTRIHHHFGQGNFTRNGIHPCAGQTLNQTGFGNNMSPSSVVTSAPGIPTPPIPSWVKNNAKWWSSGTIDDGTFAQGIQYMIQQKIVKIPQTQSTQAATGVKIPQWVRNDASYWSSNQIDDTTFIGAMQYLVQTGIISP